MLLASCKPIRLAFVAEIPPNRRQCDVITSHQRSHDVMLRHMPAEYLYALYVSMLSYVTKNKGKKRSDI